MQDISNRLGTKVVLGDTGEEILFDTLIQTNVERYLLVERDYRSGDYSFDFFNVRDAKTPILVID